MVVDHAQGWEDCNLYGLFLEIAHILRHHTSPKLKYILCHTFKLIYNWKSWNVSNPHGVIQNGNPIKNDIRFFLLKILKCYKTFKQKRKYQSIIEYFRVEISEPSYMKWIYDIFQCTQIALNTGRIIYVHIIAKYINTTRS